MKRTLVQIILALTCSILIFGCTLEKRRYMGGYHLEWLSIDEKNILPKQDYKEYSEHLHIVHYDSIVGHASRMKSEQLKMDKTDAVKTVNDDFLSEIELNSFPFAIDFDSDSISDSNLEKRLLISNARTSERAGWVGVISLLAIPLVFFATSQTILISAMIILFFGLVSMVWAALTYTVGEYQSAKYPEMILERKRLSRAYKLLMIYLVIVTLLLGTLSLFYYL